MCGARSYVQMNTIYRKQICRNYLITYVVLKLKNIKYKGMVAYMFNLSTWETKQTDFYEFKFGLVFVESSRTA